MATCQHPSSIRQAPLGRSKSCPGPVTSSRPSSIPAIPSDRPQALSQAYVCVGCRSSLNDSSLRDPSLHRQSLQSLQRPRQVPPSRLRATHDAENERRKPHERRSLRKMATKLCCTTDEDDRSSSPPLPNARMSEATPARRPLLHQKVGSHGSRFTSARSEDLHELRQIFNNAKDPSSSPERPHRSRFLRPSIHSLQSLHKMKSVQGFVKRKRSQDRPKTPPHVLTKRPRPPRQSAHAEPETIVKAPHEAPHLQGKITKSDLRKDLLSDRLPEEGGYDPDAEELDDIARRVAKKPSSKRPSLHSIEWTPSFGSRQTPDSSNVHALDAHGPRTPHRLRASGKRSTTPTTPRFGNVFSTPNLRMMTPKSKERKMRRSRSATSLRAEGSPSLMPIRLPSLKASDPDGIPWATTMHETLRLSQVGLTPFPSEKQEEKQETMPLPSGPPSTVRTPQTVFHYSLLRKPLDVTSQPLPNLVSEPVKTEAPSQETFISSLDTTSGRGLVNLSGEVSPLETDPGFESPDWSDEGNHRGSVHLYSMRISHHLRSGSLLSWDALNSPELPTMPALPRGRLMQDGSVPDLDMRPRHERQTSSSGFASSRVPSKWGNVVPPSREEMSSIYSSRPHSPPDSFGGSMGNLSLCPRHHNSSKSTNLHTVTSPEHISTDNEETPKPVKPHDPSPAGPNRSGETEAYDNGSPRPAVARHNSVANTKRSKFREEFSPTPPRKRSTPTISLMKILRPRLNTRSQSETNLKGVQANVDGPSDNSPGPTPHERDVSRSFTSMQKEQRAIGKEKEANPVWERALKSYQEERSSLFLPGNKDLARARPYRERSGSIMPRRPSMSPVPSTAAKQGPEHSPTPLSAHSPLSTHSPSVEHAEAGPSAPPKLMKRRTALIDHSHGGPDLELQAAFDKQTDDFETVGTWGRYPSHTRSERTSSAGHPDSVRTRDFALETAIQFATDDEEVDPVARPESPPRGRGRRKKKRTGSFGIAKSNSMTFGKTFIRNYTKIFRTQSTEFRRHGYGHRSSIAAGGNLEYPELELLPDVWADTLKEERRRERSHSVSGDGASDEDGTVGMTRAHKRNPLGPAQPNSQPSSSEHISKGNSKDKQKADGSCATLGPPMAVDPDLALDGVADKDTPADRARVWSIYYEECLPAYPRASADFASLSQPNLLNDMNNIHEFEKFIALRESNQDGGAPDTRPTTGRRHSLDSKRPSIRSVQRPFPGRFMSGHSRHNSRFSCLSMMSGGAASFVSGEIGIGGQSEDKSIASVRKSTMDLIRNIANRRRLSERGRWGW